MFDKLDLNHDVFKNLKGVFVIWHENNGIKNVVNVGTGNIAEELKKARKNIAITAFTHYGLYCTWVELSTFKIEGVANYLNDKLNPKIKLKELTNKSTPVNIPW
ncbi:MAG: hypothetical protein NT007_12890 [Candidatus Kapabacteria bacterium]|nr:hypothetical protein [Candidatus Kapabacteria bacterium]